MEKNKWYERPMRIAALQCNFEGGRARTLGVPAKWREMGFNVEQLFHPMAESYCALFNKRRYGPLLTQYLKEARARKLRVILYLNIHIITPSLAFNKKTWAQRTPDGRYTMFYDTYFACCVNSPWRDHFFRSLEDLKEYDIDGVFLDGPNVSPGGCHCPSCRAKYLREFGRPMKKDADLWEFSRKSLDDFLRESYRRFKAIKPDGVHYINLGVMHLTGSYMRLPDALDYNDILGTEGGFMFYGSPKNAYVYKTSIAAKVLEAVAPARPRVIFMAGDQKPWSWLMHTGPETALCIASTVANGANIWYGLHGSTRLLDTDGARAARKILRELSRMDGVLADTRAASRVGVMYSLTTEKYYRKSKEQTDLYGSSSDGGAAGYLGNFTAAFQGVCEALSRSSIPFDVFTDFDLTLARLQAFDCVILPTSACLDDATVSLLREYVSRGGRLAAAFDTSLFDGRGKMRRDFGLAEVLGVSFAKAVLDLKYYNYFKPGKTHRLWNGFTQPLFPAPALALAVVPRKGAQVLAKYLKPLPGRYVPLTAPDKPALVWNKFGKGQSLYLSGTFWEMADDYAPPEYRRMLANAVSWLAPDSIRLEGVLGNVEMTVRRPRDENPKRLIIFLVNYAGLPPRPYEKIVPQAELSVRVPRFYGSFSRARSLVNNKAYPLRREAGGARVVVPELREYDVLVVE